MSDVPAVIPPALDGRRLDTKAELAKVRKNRLQAACLPVCWECARIGNCYPWNGCVRGARAAREIKKIIEKFNKENP